MWITSAGTFLTAGHCIDEDNIIQAVQFNVPLSEPDGTPVFSDPVDQYPVDRNSIVFDPAFLTLPDILVPTEDDWGLFEALPNDISGQHPAVANDTFIRLTDDEPALNQPIRLTGYGRDNDPPGTDPENDFLNTANRTLQTDVGRLSFNFSGGFYEVNDVDQSEGNSGSPFLHNGLGIGIQRGPASNVRCRPSTHFGDAKGAKVTVSDLRAALEGSVPDTVYLDAGHPTTTQTGTIFDPEITLSAAVSQVNAGGTIKIVKGTYSGNITISKSLTLKAPVGRVTIGGSGAGLAAKDGDEAKSQEADTPNDTPKHVRLLGNYPNPFNPTTEIRFELLEATHVALVVYDVLGRKVTQLLDQTLETGHHNVRFDASRLPSGVYFYYIEADDITRTEQMVLVK